MGRTRCSAIGSRLWRASLAAATTGFLTPGQPQHHMLGITLLLMISIQQNFLGPCKGVTCDYCTASERISCIINHISVTAADELMSI